MACALTTGRSRPCIDAIGGLSKIYFFDRFEDPFTITAGEATAMDVALTDAYEYDLHGDNSNYVETLTADANNGTSVYEQVITASFTKVDVDTTNELALLAKAAPIAVIKDRMGNYRIVGITDGVVAAGSIESGGAKGDFNGYNLTFTATEVLPAPTMDSSTVTAFEGIVSATKITA